jgi:xylulokinase
MSLNKYDYTDSLLEASVPGSGGLLFLPYLSGERFPVMDAKIKGAYIGIDNETNKANMARACLEGVAFSIRQGLEAISSERAKKISLVGGGVKTILWRQVLADVLQSPITVTESPAGEGTDSSEYLPAAAIAGSVLIAQGLETGYNAYIAGISGNEKALSYYPAENAVPVMDAQYKRFCTLYSRIRDLFN